MVASQLQLMCLESLDISYCPSLVCFPKGELPTTLKELYIECCENLESVPEGMMHHSNCSSLKSFRTGELSSTLKQLECLHSLTHLIIGRCKNLKSLPHQMRNLKSLQVLAIRDCPGVECFPKGGLAPNLTSLYICDCKNMKTPISEWSLHTLTSLYQLTIKNMFPDMLSFSDEECPLPISLTSLTINGMESLASLAFQNLISLTSLTIHGMESLASLALQNLISLQSLCISNCSNLRSLGLMPATLGRLEVIDCPTIKERCLKDKGGPTLPTSPAFGYRDNT